MASKVLSLSGREVDWRAAPISFLSFSESRCGIEAADADAAAVEIAEAFEDFDGGGFAGAVGAEEAEDFAFVDAEADAADGFEIAVALDEIFYLDDGFGHR